MASPGDRVEPQLYSSALYSSATRLELGPYFYARGSILEVDPQVAICSVLVGFWISYVAMVMVLAWKRTTSYPTPHLIRKWI
jgi:hypothetical protein